MAEIWVYIYIYVHTHTYIHQSFTQSCPTLCNPMNCSLPGSSVHGIFQAGILEWVAISFSRGSSQPRDQTWVSHIASRFFTTGPPREKLTLEKETWKDQERYPESSKRIPRQGLLGRQSGSCVRHYLGKQQLDVLSSVQDIRKAKTSKVWPTDERQTQDSGWRS